MVTNVSGYFTFVVTDGGGYEWCWLLMMVITCYYLVKVTDVVFAFMEYVLYFGYFMMVTDSDVCPYEKTCARSAGSYPHSIDLGEAPAVKVDILPDFWLVWPGHSDDAAMVGGDLMQPLYNTHMSGKVDGFFAKNMPAL